jgi:hypothetical protein
MGECGMALCVLVEGKTFFTAAPKEDIPSYFKLPFIWHFRVALLLAVLVLCPLSLFHSSNDDMIDDFPCLVSFIFYALSSSF